MIDPHTSLILSSGRPRDAARPSNVLSQDVSPQDVSPGLQAGGAIFARAMNTATKNVATKGVIDIEHRVETTARHRHPPSDVHREDHRPDHHHDPSVARESGPSETRPDRNSDHRRHDPRRHDDRRGDDSRVQDARVQDARVQDSRVDQRDGLDVEDASHERSQEKDIPQEKDVSQAVSQARGPETPDVVEQKSPDQTPANPGDASGDSSGPDVVDPGPALAAIDPVPDSLTDSLGKNDGRAWSLSAGTHSATHSASDLLTIPEQADQPVGVTPGQTTHHNLEVVDAAVTPATRLPGHGSEHDLGPGDVRLDDAGLDDTGLQNAGLGDTGFGGAPLPVDTASKTAVSDAAVTGATHANPAVPVIEPTFTDLSHNDLSHHDGSQVGVDPGMPGTDHDLATSPNVDALSMVNPAPDGDHAGHADGDAPTVAVTHAGRVRQESAYPDSTYPDSTYQDSARQDWIDDRSPVSDRHVVNDTEFANRATAHPAASIDPAPHTAVPNAATSNTSIASTTTANAATTTNTVAMDRVTRPGTSTLVPVMEPVPGADPDGRPQRGADSAASLYGAKENSARDPVAASLRPVSHPLQRGLIGDQAIKNQGLDVRLQVTSENGPPPRPAHTLASALVAQEIPQPTAETRAPVLEGVLQQRIEVPSSRASGSAEHLFSSAPSSVMGSKSAGGAGSQTSGPQTSGPQSLGVQTSGVQSSGSQGLGTLPIVSSSGGGSVHTSGTPLVFPLVPDSALPTNGGSRPQPPSFPHQAALPEQVAVQIHKAAAKGMDRVSIQLKPAELGRVEVHMDMRADHRTAVTVVVERPETLDLLQRDVRGLEQSLRDAGLKTDGGTLQFSLRGERHGGDSSKDGDGRQSEKNDNSHTKPSREYQAMEGGLTLSGSSEGRLNLVV